jgi:DNA invertase Pin-like site-specific DNA recombinase
MVGPSPAGRPWTRDEEARLIELLGSGMKARGIARKLKRSTGAVYARINFLKSARSTARSLPSERAAFFHAHASSNTYA